jgi:glycerophosphoryl diester phosphodiesterase
VDKTVNMSNIKFILFLLILSCRADAQVKLISRAISANDHKRKAPLTEALNAGFAGISADLKLDKDGKLVTGKHPFRETYLQALHDRIVNNNGTVYPGKKIDFILYLEISNDSINICKALFRTLDEYASDLGIYADGEKKGGPLLVILSGHVPHSMVTQEQNLRVMVDELSPSERTAPVVYLSHINFGKNFSWNGEKNMPNMQYHSFATRVKLAKKAGRKVIVSNYPDSENAIEILIGAGVDFLMIENINEFVQFWTNRKPY